MGSNSEHIVTTIIKYHIRKDTENEFEIWLKGITKSVSGFKGFKSKQIISKKEDELDIIYIIMFQFNSLEYLLVWMDSEERREALQQLVTLSIKKTELKYYEGVDFCFALQEKIKQPVKWKMAFLTWVFVFIGVLSLVKFYHFIFPKVSPVLNTFLVTSTLVILLSWCIMPFITRLLKKWLFSN